MVLAAFLVAPLVFRIGLTARSIAVLVIGGILLGWLDDVIGSLPAVCIGVLGLAFASAWMRRSRLRRSRTILELPD
ncbi:MAG TPA: hypothetical protein VIC58_07095 [Actinomycetota bacterium]|jgi:hypothetical protein